MLRNNESDGMVGVLVDPQTQGSQLLSLERLADLTKLDASGVQTLIRTADKSKLAMALKGASDQLKDLFFSNMSERAGKILREDMEAMGPVRLRDVDEAQSHLVNTAKELAAKGEIIIADAKGEDELVY